MTRLTALLFALFLFGCTAEAGRDPVARETAAQVDTEPDSEPTEPNTEAPPQPTTAPEQPDHVPTCEPATCDDDLTAVSLPYFTAPDCSAESMLIPLLPDDPAAGWTLCTDDDRAWVTGEQVSEPEALWSGSPGDCREMPATPIGLEWWAAVSACGPGSD
jgi:hypothetical protein